MRLDGRNPDCRFSRRCLLFFPKESPSMKIDVFDTHHIISQIKCASPPSSKEMHKLLNNLSILLEKNTAKKSSPLESTLVSSVERLNETFVDLCFLRKEIVRKFSQEYFDILSNALAQLKRNKYILYSEDAEHPASMQWDLNTTSGSSSLMPAIFCKLHKAKGIIEDALQKSNDIRADADGWVEAFFTDV